MEYKKAEKDIYIVRISRGEKIVASLSALCKKQQVYGGFFYGLGAVDKVEIAHYNVDTKKYSRTSYNEAFEVTNIAGSIGIDAETHETIVHAHITLSDTEMKAFGGHLVEARVSGTIELLLQATEKLVKVKDSETGLKLFELKP